MKSRDIVTNPHKFIKGIDDSVAALIDTRMAETTQDWEARNQAGTISGSSFALCLRQAWYRFKNQGNEPNATFTPVAKQKMFLGHNNEDIMIKALEYGVTAGVLGGETHTEQQSQPVNETVKRGTAEIPILFSSTTDIVKRFLDEGKHFEIPIELKNTEAHDYIKAKFWWDNFHPHADHLRQLAQNMLYKKENGIHVPFGLLRYSRRATYEAKNYLVIDTNDPVGKHINLHAMYGEVPQAETKVYNYEILEEIVSRRMQVLEECIVNDILPPFPGLQTKKQEDEFDENIPEYRCNTCPFKKDCWASRD